MGAVLLSLLGAASLAGTPSAVLSWVAPTTFTDGSPLTGTVTYNVYQGPTGAETLTTTGVTALTWSANPASLTAGSSICWTVTAVVGGVESAPSNEVCKSFPKVSSPPSTLTVK